MKKLNIVFLILLFTFTSNIYANSLTDYQKQMEEIKAERRATTQKLTGLEREISQDMYDMIELDGRVTEFSIRLNDLQKKADEVNEKLQHYEQSLQNSAQTFNNAEQIYLTRLRIIYENGIPSIFDIFLSSQSISDFFSKINVLTSILEYDRSLVKNMRSQKEYIDYIKNNIEIQKIQLDQLKYDTEKSAQALENAVIAKQNKIDSIKESQENLKAKAEALAKQEQETGEKIRAEIARIARLESTFGGKFAWPVPGFTRISAHFGWYDPWRTGTPRRHFGMDIAGAGIFGKPMVAAESGKVILAKYYGGYGNCVIIDHGKSLDDGAYYRTLYAHASSINVTVGQIVVRGQTVGFVGSTGNSTGPHLHFEVIKNGTNVNPYDYVK